MKNTREPKISISALICSMALLLLSSNIANASCDDQVERGINWHNEVNYYQRQYNDLVGEWNDLVDDDSAISFEFCSIAQRMDATLRMMEETVEDCMSVWNDVIYGGCYEQYASSGQRKMRQALDRCHDGQDYVYEEEDWVESRIERHCD